MRRYQLIGRCAIAQVEEEADGTERSIAASIFDANRRTEEGIPAISDPDLLWLVVGVLDTAALNKLNRAIPKSFAAFYAQLSQAGKNFTSSVAVDGAHCAGVSIAEAS